MSAGRIVQRGTPREIYETPKTNFVADFVGAINFIDATVTQMDLQNQLMVLDSEVVKFNCPLRRRSTLGMLFKSV
jgi:ABC-type Fe3+/spermidine/putrescine transport system ATPase subunit